MPGVCFIFSPTMAIVARPDSADMGNIAPVSISFLNSSLSTSTAASASSSRTPIDVEFSDEACDTRNTDMPLSASAVNIRLFTPITPTIDSPVTVMSVVPFMLDMPLMGLLSSSIFSFISVPGCSGLKVFLTFIGMFLTHTGYIVGGYMTLAPKLQSSMASMNESWLIVYAAGMTRGSAVMNPSTSVHISSMSALSAAAIIAAV